MLSGRLCRHSLGRGIITRQRHEIAQRHAPNCIFYTHSRCISTRAAASSGDYEEELREQIRELARQGWTFKKPSQPAKANKPLKAGIEEAKTTTEQSFASQHGIDIDELAAAPRPSQASCTQPTPSTTDTTILGFESPVVPPLQGPPALPTTSPHASPESVGQSSSTQTSGGHPSASQETGTSSAASAAAASQAPAQSGLFADRLGYSVATGSDLPSLTKSIIGTLNKEEGCWVAAATPNNCTLALQAITSARKAAIHAGLFEIVFQPHMAAQADAQPRLEFLLTKFELDSSNETLIEGPSVYPGTWPKDDAAFGRRVVEYLEQEQQVILRCGGVNHSSQAARALVIAQDILHQQQLELQVSPEWHVGKDRGVKLDLLVELIELDDGEEGST